MKPISRTKHNIIVSLFGLLPCTLCALLWIPGIFIGATIYLDMIKTMNWEKILSVGGVLLPLALGGLLGFVLFTQSLFGQKKPWGYFQYICGLWGLASTVTLQCSLLVEMIGDIKNVNDLGGIMVLFLILSFPIIALYVAWAQQHNGFTPKQHTQNDMM